MILPYEPEEDEDDFVPLPGYGLDTPPSQIILEAVEVEPVYKKKTRKRTSKDDPFRDEKFTPPKLLLPLMQEDHYTLDVASNPRAPAAQIIRRFITKEQNGLAFSWRRERVWCNPPFSNIAPWLEKAWSEFCFTRMLLPAWTDRSWWHKYIEPYRDRPGSRLSTRFLPRQLFGNPVMPVREKGQPDFWPVLLRFEALE
jgi:hypothetical protein